MQLSNICTIELFTTTSFSFRTLLALKLHCVYKNARRPQFCQKLTPFCRRLWGMYSSTFEQYWSHGKKFKLKQQSYHAPVNKIAGSLCGSYSDPESFAILTFNCSLKNDLPLLPVVLFVPSLPLAQWRFLQGALLVPNNEATSSSNLIDTPIQPCGPGFTTARLVLLCIPQFFLTFYFFQTHGGFYIYLCGWYHQLIRVLKKKQIGKTAKIKELV